MTPQELREKRTEILQDIALEPSWSYRTKGIETALDALEALDTEQAALPSLMTPEGQRDYYQNTAAEMSDELTRVSLSLAWYEAHEEKAIREGDTSPRSVQDFWRHMWLEQLSENRRLLDRLKTQDLFARVLNASSTYVLRFGGAPSREGALNKLREELDEMIEAVDEYRAWVEVHHSAAIEADAEVAAAGEAIDLIVTVGGFLWAMGIDYRHLDRAAHDTLTKLDSRTDEHYAWNPTTNTVERKETGQ
jgi:hypothetical protein